MFRGSTFGSFLKVPIKNLSPTYSSHCPHKNQNNALWSSGVYRNKDRIFVHFTAKFTLGYFLSDFFDTSKNNHFPKFYSSMRAISVKKKIFQTTVLKLGIICINIHSRISLSSRLYLLHCVWQIIKVHVFSSYNQYFIFSVF